MKKILYVILCCSLILSVSSCEGFLDEKPYSELTPENSFSSAEDWEKTLNSAYAMLQRVFVGKYTITLGEFGTDEVEPYDLGWAAYAELKNYTFSPSHPFFLEHYNDCYEGIKRCNTVIDMETELIDDTRMDIMKAEAKFLRALYYFDLVKMYGGVPLWTKSNVNKNQIMKPRSSLDEIYTQITQDMHDAEKSLPTKWINKTDKGRATTYAASALLARIYLQWGKPNDALVACNKVMGKFKLYDDYSKIFLPAYKNEEYENIFEVQFKHSGSWGQEGSIQANYWGPRGVGGPTQFGGWGGFGPTQYIYDSFESKDKRREAFFITEHKGVIQSPPCCKKYIDPEFGNVIEDDGLNFRMIRYADVLLMKAEALNALNDNSDDKYNCINEVRSRAGIDPILKSQDLSKEQFADILLEERLHELCFEHLRRWDLLRFGKLADQIKAVYDITIKNYHILYPIPQNAIDANDAITANNPGY